MARDYSVMDEEQYIYRGFRRSDYTRCENLVSNAWQFDRIFQPQGLANVTKRLYTGGSLVNSNYFEVVEIGGEVVGFIFGLNEEAKQPRKLPMILFGLGVLLRLLLVRGVEKGTKKKLMNAINTHNVNRYKLVQPGRSEITLFVVDPAHQGRGAGKRLLAGLLDSFTASGVKSTIVETNTRGAASFYEKEGFSLIGFFDSPLHRYAEPEGRAGMYEITNS